MTRVLMISTDRKIFDNNSLVRERMIEYGSIFDELNIVVLTKRGEAIGQLPVHLSPKVRVFATESAGRLSAIKDAFKVGMQILDSATDLNFWVITTQDPFETGLVGRKLKRVFKLPLQIQVHTDLLNIHFAHDPLNNLRFIVARQVLKSADSLRVVSERIKRSLVNDYRFAIPAEKISVLPIFIDLEKIRSLPVSVDLHKKYPQFGKIVLIASRLTKEKNLFFALKVFRRLLKETPEAGLVIVGDGPKRLKLEKKAKSWGIADRVKFEGWQDNLVSYYKTADTFLSTSFYEGFGLTIVEAIALGLPVVSSNVGIASQALTSVNGSVCEYPDIDCFVHRLWHFLAEGRFEPGSGDINFSQIMTTDKADYLRKYQQAIEIIARAR
ncbi:MAG: glycosyltransferase [Candidatus Paceibacterota bacterium]